MRITVGRYRSIACPPSGSLLALAYLARARRGAARRRARESSEMGTVDYRFMQRSIIYLYAALSILQL